LRIATDQTAVETRCVGDLSTFPMGPLDYAAFAAFFVVLSLVGYLAGRRERASSDDYFLAGRSLPWYVVGSSFIASNISTEHFIGMIGAAFVYGVCTAMACWGNVFSFSLIIWFFIPFLLASRVFTMPEFLERRYNPLLRQFFALVTVVSNVVAFLAAVLYGGALALQVLFGWPLWLAIILLGVVSGIWAIYGGLSSVAWTDLVTVIVMLIGGVMVTVLGLKMLGGETGTLLDGFANMIEANKAETGMWKEAVNQTATQIVGYDTYNRLSVIQPASHQMTPWPNLVLGVFSISIWYNVLNQFMIQRVLGAKNMYHARMGIVLAGFIQALLPLIIVVPGLILFARYPNVLKLPWDQVRPEADKGYVQMLQTLVPVGLRGLFLAALFGAIQSTVNSVLNSSSTIITLDFYKRLFRPDAGEKQIVWVGVLTSAVVLVVAMLLGWHIQHLRGSLFIYIQTLYAFFAPPFSAIFLLGMVWRRINATGATVAAFSGFALGIAMKLYVHYVPDHPTWLAPYANQAIINWLFCVAVCTAVSLATPPPKPEQLTDALAFRWRSANILVGLGTRWYNSIVTWWLIFVLTIAILVTLFSGFVLR